MKELVKQHAASISSSSRPTVVNWNENISSSAFKSPLGRRSKWTIEADETIARWRERKQVKEEWKKAEATPTWQHNSHIWGPTRREGDATLIIPCTIEKGILTRQMFG